MTLSPASFWVRGEPDLNLGNVAWYADRSSGGLWILRSVPRASERTMTTAREVRFIGETHERGQDAWVIWYSFNQFSIEVPFPVWRTEWIAKDSLRLLRQVQDNDDPLGTRSRIESVVAYPDD